MAARKKSRRAGAGRPVGTGEILGSEARPVQSRFSSAEYAALTAAAKRAQTTPSRWVALAALEKLGISRG